MKPLLHRYETLIFSLLYLLVRYAHIPAFFSAEGFAPQGTDPFLRLYLIEKKIRQGLANISFDPNISFPGGGNIALAPGMEYLFAIPAKLLGLQESPDIAMFCMLALPLLGLPLIWLIKPIERQWTNQFWVRFLIYLSLILFPIIIGFTSIGRVDHTVLGSVLFLWTWYMIANRSHRHTPHRWVWTFGLGAFFWPHIWVLAPWAALMVSIQDRTHLKKWSGYWAVAALVSILPMFLTDYYMKLPVSPYQYSYFATVVLLAIASVTYLVGYLLDTKKTPRDHLFALGTIVLVILAIFVTWQTWWGFIKGLTLFFSASQNTLKDTAEARNIFWLLSGRSFQTDMLWIFLVPLAMGWAWYKKQARGLVLFTLLPLFLCFQQIRFANVLYPLAFILILCSLWQIVNLVVQQNVFKKKILLFFGIYVVLILPFANQLGKSNENRHPFYLSVKKAAQFLNQHANQGSYTRQESGIVAPWSYGYWLMYYAQLPVVANPGQGKSATTVKEFYMSNTAEQFDSFFDKYPARYLFALDDPSQLGEKHTDFVTSDIHESEEIMQNKRRKLLGTLLGKFFTLNALTIVDHPMGVWRVVYASPYIFREGQKTSSLKVFERVPGAYISLRAPNTGPMYITTEIEIFPEEKFRYDLPSLYKDGVYYWTVPYGAVDDGGIVFDGQYRVEKKNGQLVGKVDVSQKDIYAGTHMRVIVEPMEIKQP